jgi:hypothetical protein
MDPDPRFGTAPHTNGRAPDECPLALLCKLGRQPALRDDNRPRPPGLGATHERLRAAMTLSGPEKVSSPKLRSFSTSSFGALLLWAVEASSSPLAG